MTGLYILIAVSGLVFVATAIRSTKTDAALNELTRITFWTALAVALIAVYLK